MCEIADGLKRVPRVDVFMAGFMCVDYTSMSSLHSKYVSSIDKVEGRGSETFWFAVRYMRKHKPGMSFLENVGGIDDDGESIGIVLHLHVQVCLDMTYLMAFHF